MERPNKPSERDYHIHEYRKILEQSYVGELEKYCDSLEQEILELKARLHNYDLVTHRYEKAIDKAIDKAFDLNGLCPYIENWEEQPCNDDKNKKCRECMKEWCLRGD